MHLKDFNNTSLGLSNEDLDTYVEKFGHTSIFWHKFNTFLVDFKIPEEKFFNEYYEKFKKYEVSLDIDYIGYFISSENASKLYPKDPTFIVKLPWEQFKKEYINNLHNEYKYWSTALYYFDYNKDITEEQIDIFLKEIKNIKNSSIDKELLLSQVDIIFSEYLENNLSSEQFIQKWFSDLIKHYPLDIYLGCRRIILSCQNVSEQFILKFYDEFKDYLDELNNNCYMDKDVRQKFLNLLKLQRL